MWHHTISGALVLNDMSVQSRTKCLNVCILTAIRLWREWKRGTEGANLISSLQSMNKIFTLLAVPLSLCLAKAHCQLNCSIQSARGKQLFRYLCSHNCCSHSSNSLPCYLQHMVWHHNRMLNSALMWLQWKVRDLFLNILLSHTTLKIGLCVEAQTHIIIARLWVFLWCSLDWVTLNLAWLVGKFLAFI